MKFSIGSDLPILGLRRSGALPGPFQDPTPQDIGVEAIATRRDRMLLGAPGIATRSKDAIRLEAIATRVEPIPTASKQQTCSRCPCPQQTVETTRHHMPEALVQPQTVSLMSDDKRIQMDGTFMCKLLVECSCSCWLLFMCSVFGVLKVLHGVLSHLHHE